MFRQAQQLLTARNARQVIRRPAAVSALRPAQSAVLRDLQPARARQLEQRPLPGKNGGAAMHFLICGRTRYRRDRTAREPSRLRHRAAGEAPDRWRLVLPGVSSGAGLGPVSVTAVVPGAGAPRGGLPGGTQPGRRPGAASCSRTTVARSPRSGRGAPDGTGNASSRPTENTPLATPRVEVTAEPERQLRLLHPDPGTQPGTDDRRRRWPGHGRPHRLPGHRVDRRFNPAGRSTRA